MDYEWKLQFASLFTRHLLWSRAGRDLTQNKKEKKAFEKLSI